MMYCTCSVLRSNVQREEELGFLVVSNRSHFSVERVAVISISSWLLTPRNWWLPQLLWESIPLVTNLRQLKTTGSVLVRRTAVVSFSLYFIEFECRGQLLVKFAVVSCVDFSSAPGPSKSKTKAKGRACGRFIYFLFAVLKWWYHEWECNLN